MDNELAKALLENEITEDEEFERAVEQSNQEIKKKEEQDENKHENNTVNYSKNQIAEFIKIIAILQVIGGLIIGYQLGSYTTGTYFIQTKLNGGIMFMWFVVGVISAVLTLGFAEVIQILHEIRLNTSKDK